MAETRCDTTAGTVWGATDLWSSEFVDGEAVMEMAGKTSRIIKICILMHKLLISQSSSDIAILSSRLSGIDNVSSLPISSEQRQQKPGSGSGFWGGYFYQRWVEPGGGVSLPALGGVGRSPQFQMRQGRVSVEALVTRT